MVRTLNFYLLVLITLFNFIPACYRVGVEPFPSEVGSADADGNADTVSDADAHDCIPDCTDRECGMDPVCGTSDCGICPEGRVCGVDGFCDCIPGFTECDGDCCAEGQVCHENACCIPDTCADLSGPCGFVPDGCGGEIECGSCFPCSEVLSGSVVPAERDSFTFVASAGEVIDIVARTTASENVPFFRLSLELYSPTGTLVTSTLDVQTAEIRDEILSESGAFTFFVYDAPPEVAGDYNVGRYRLNSPICNPIEIACSEVLSGSLVPAEKHAFTFEGTAGDVISII